MRRLVFASAPLLVFTTFHSGCGSDADPHSAPAGQAGVGAAAGSGGEGNAGSGGSGNAGSGGSGNASSGGAGGSGGSGNASSGGSGNADASADADLPDVVFVYEGPDGSGQDACAETSVTTQLKPLDMYVMFDRSGSMSEPGFAWYAPASDCDVGAPIVNSRWCRAVNGLGQYFMLPAAAGNRAAIQYFPRAGVTTCGGASTAGYGVAAVGLTLLPSATSGPLINSLNAEAPLGTYTPTHDAILGLNAFTSANKDPNRQMISVLITDGLPNSCAINSETGLAQLLAQHHAATGIPTYVIGVTGVDFAKLEVIAQGGGTLPHPTQISGFNNLCGNGATSCYHWNVGDGDPNVFVQALKSIQQQAVGCTLDIPLPSQGVPDWSQVKVQYLPGGNPPPQQLPKVNFASNCSGPGWYYDNNASPTKINLCPSTCTTVQADPAAKVELLLGCLGS
ncbi:MAG: VWA domain-containing protein [Polyangiaceae bacterium]|nr:VWA domain-containing protein [Polyangiaceae bacterium]